VGLPSWWIRAASLLGVLVLARLVVLRGRDLPGSPWTAAAILRDDALVALAFAVLDRLLLGRLRLAWVLYGAAVLWTALNTPVFRVLSTPLTPSMLRGARGALLDSVAHHANLEGALAFLAPLLGGALLPLLLRRAPRASFIAAGCAALLIAALGTIGLGRVDTAGLHRSAFIALLGTSLPQAPGGAGTREWRASPIPEASPAEDLTRLRGSLSGRDVLLVFLESAGAAYLRPYGASEDPMPGLTALAREALVFESAYAVYPESIKGLYSVIRSVHPALDTSAETLARARGPTLATELSTAGYRTGLFHSGRFVYLGMDAVVDSLGHGTAEDAGAIGGRRESSFGVDEESAVRRILAWVDGLGRDERFLVTYLPIAGHHPYETPRPGPFPEAEEIDRYRNALHYADSAVGALLDGLAERGRLERTLLVFLGDHGEAFHQHEGNYGHTFHVWEENVRVPLVIAARGSPIREEIRIARAASLVDIAPTVLDLLGLVPPAAMEGASLLEPGPRMALFFTDYSLHFLGLRDGPWKLIHELESGRSKLFDLAADPGEREDLSARHPERVEAYRARLLEWSGWQRDRLLRLAESAPGR